MKLLAFWPDAAEVWFVQAETQFAIRIVSVSKTKFYHAVTVLPQEDASHILDLIRAPPARHPYEVLRECLITLYTLNNYQRFEALVSLPLLGDQKPSHLMNRMLPFFQMITSRTSFSGGCFFNASLSTSILIFSARRFWILVL